MNELLPTSTAQPHDDRASMGDVRETNFTAPLTKIIATVGPASSEPEQVARLIDAGVSVFRFNFSHGSLNAHAERLRTIRAIAADRAQPAAILGDLQGPKIRVGKVVDEGVRVEKGSFVIFQREPVIAKPAPGHAIEPIRFSTTYHDLITDVRPGQRLLVNDGAVRMLIVECEQDAITCAVTQSGLITSGKGINLPDTDLALSTMTDRDWEHVKWAIENDLDFLALSFVRRAEDIHHLAGGISKLRPSVSRSWRLPIIAKIEVPAAVRAIEEIVDAADGIMVARGDLGVEMDLAQVPVIQKRLVAIAQDYGKPCIVATQMFESMIDSPAPTRAEANDVASAIFDQADAVMLSGETAVGKYPVLAVEQMRRIAQHTEHYLASQPAAPSPPRKLVESGYRTAALAHGVWVVAHDIRAKCIVVWSETGGGARYLSQNNFHIPIIAVTSNERAAHQMQLLRGVTPVRMEIPRTVDLFMSAMDDYLRETDRARTGEQCVVVLGEPLGTPRITNQLMIHAVR